MRVNRSGRLTCLLVVLLLLLAPAVQAGERKSKVKSPYFEVRVGLDIGSKVRVKGAVTLEEKALVLAAGVDSPWTGIREGKVRLELVFPEPGETRRSKRHREVRTRRVEKAPSRVRVTPSVPVHSVPRRETRAQFPPVFTTAAGVYLAEPLRGMHLVTLDKGTIDTLPGALPYSLSYEYRRGRADPRWGHLQDPAAFMRVVVECWYQLRRFLLDRGLPTEPRWGPDYNINIFAVWMDSLADPRKAKPFLDRLDRRYRSGVLWGYYDSTVLVDNQSFIVVTPVGGRDTRGIIAHELGHFAWDYFLLAGHWRGDSESFARAFHRWLR